MMTYIREIITSRLYVSRKERERGYTCIEDFVDVSKTREVHLKEQIKTNDSS